MRIRLRPLDAQVVVVTGASSGIGLATALLAASRGARVALVARSRTTLEEIAETIRDRGGVALAIGADVGDRDAIERVAATAQERLGTIDTWVNAAGVTVVGRLLEVDDADQRRLLETNFWGVVHGSLVAVRRMAARGGALINVGGSSDDDARPLRALTVASKRAVEAFTDALRIELRDEGVPVSVTLVRPAPVDTPLDSHARNYLRDEPGPPPATVQPLEVAEAILDAAGRPRRDAWITAPASLAGLGARLAPRFVRRRLAASSARRHDAPETDPLGALHRPSEASGAGAGRIRGLASGAATGPRARRAAAAVERARAGGVDPASPPGAGAGLDDGVDDASDRRPADARATDADAQARSRAAPAGSATAPLAPGTADRAGTD